MSRQLGNKQRISTPNHDRILVVPFLASLLDFRRSSSLNSGHVRPQQGTKFCNFGVPSPLEPVNSPQQDARINQRTPWGGKKRGLENLMNDTPPQKGFWTPPSSVRFPPLSGVSALFFLYKNPRQRGPEALLGAVQKFSGECVLW